MQPRPRTSLAFALTLLVAWSTGAAIPARAAVPRLVQDINGVADRDSDPRLLGSLGNKTLFIAHDGQQVFVPNVAGYRSPFALWATDGSSTATVLLQEFPIEETVFASAGVITSGDRLYFAVARPTDTSARALWVTDGTRAGTAVLDSEVLTLLGTIDHFLVYTKPGVSDIELWRSDGTPGGAVHLANLGAVNAQSAVTVAGQLYFSASTSAHGEEPWVTDGSVAGTHLVSDIVAGPESSRAQNYVAMGEAVYFRALPSPTSRLELWRIDPATNSAALVRPPAPGFIHATTLVVLGSQLFYFYEDSGNYELWASDGTAAGTRMVADINGHANSGSISAQSELRAVGARVLFFADDQIHGEQIWSSDGTAAGTQPVAAATLTFAAGASSVLLPKMFPAMEVWITDGTSAGTRPLVRLQERIETVAESGGRFFMLTSIQPLGGSKTYQLRTMTAADQAAQLVHSGSEVDSLVAAPYGAWFVDRRSPVGREPYVSDGTVAGTGLLKNIAAETTTRDSVPSDFMEFNGQLYFAANDGVAGRELWRSDGTAAGTQLVVDLEPGPRSSSPERLFVANGRLYFFASVFDGTLNSVQFLWTTDGTAAGTTRLVRLNPWGSGRPPRCPQPRPPTIGDYAFFSASRSESGLELWRTNGTLQGTNGVVNLVPQTGGSYPCNVVLLGNRLYFSALQISTGRAALWTSDDTIAGTQVVADADLGLSLPWAGPVVFKDRLYFSAIAPNTATRQLWRSDGTTAGTSTAHEPQGASFVSAPIALSEHLLFAVDTEERPGTLQLAGELWSLDASGTGIRMATAVDRRRSSPLDARLGRQESWLNVGAQLFFSTLENDGPANVWRTDGTSAGTRVVAAADTLSSAEPVIWFGNFRSTGMFLVKRASGAELWRTDGTTAGTSAVGPLAPLDPDTHYNGPQPYPRSGDEFGVEHQSPIAAGNHLFFIGRDPAAGIELFALENEQAVTGHDTASVTAGNAVSIDVLGNDRDPDGALNRATVRVVTQPAGGTATTTPAGSLVYAARANFSGADSLQYTVQDAQGRESLVATVTIQVAAQPGPHSRLAPWWRLVGFALVSGIAGAGHWSRAWCSYWFAVASTRPKSPFLLAARYAATAYAATTWFSVLASICSSVSFVVWWTSK